MPIVEYPAGTAFPGVIGRTTEESSPAWPAPVRAREGRPERAVHRARRHRVRAARLLRQPDRDAEPRRARRERPALQQHAHHGAVLAVPFLHHHRPQPPRQRHGRHHRARDRLSRATTASCRSRTGCCRRCCVEQGYNTFMVGKWHLTPSNQETAAGPVRPLAAGPRLRALLRLPRRRHEPVVSRPRLRQPPGRAAADARGGLPPQPRTWSTRRSSSSPTPSRSTPTSPSTCTSASARPTPRTTCAKEWADRYAGRVRRRLGRLPRAGRSRARRSSGIVPADAELSRHDPDVPDWDSLPPEARRLYSPDDGGVRRLPQPHRPPDRAAARLPARDRRARQHPDHGHLRQRRERRGRPDRHDERGAVLQQRPGAARGEPRRDRRDRRPRRTSTTTRGAGRGRATPRSGAGSARPTAAARRDPFIVSWPTGITARGEVRTQYAHIIDMVPDRPRRARASSRPPTIRGVTQAPLHGVSFAHTFDDADAPSNHHTQYFEMFGHRAIYHDGWRAVCPWPGPSFAEAGIAFGAADHRRDAVRARRRPAGSCTTSPRTSRRTTNVAAEQPRPADRDDRAPGTSRPASTT